MIREHAVGFWLTVTLVLWLASVLTFGVTLTFEKGQLAGWGVLGFALIAAGCTMQAKVVRDRQ